MNNFREYNQAQGVFRPIVPHDLLEPEHPARVIDRVVHEAVGNSDVAFCEERTDTSGGV